MTRRALALTLAAAVTFAATCEPGPEPADGGTPSAPAPQSRRSILHRLAFYLPNRVLDALDMVRARVRIGPGIAVSARITDFDAFHAGVYRSVYAGLPGPRGRPRIPVPVVVEELKSVSSFFGIDATDDTRHGPAYSESEADLGVQVLIAGADAGFDAVELGDFLAGLIMLEPRGDDF